MFAHFRRLQAEGNQVELAKQYGILKGARFKVKYIVEKQFENGSKKYEVNE
jgi:hypothetical protein